MSGITVTTNETATPSAPRKRKRPNQNTYPIAWSEVKEIDPHGRTREVIVIEDTPPPTPHSPTTSIRSAVFNTSSSYIPPIRTRAQAAAAAVNTASMSAAAPPTRKRKREQQEDGEVTGSHVKRAYVPNATAPTSFPSGSAATAPTDEAAKTPGSSQASTKAPSCDDKEGHYIVAVDDVIYDRYRTVRLLGQGTFGKVVEAVDTHTGRSVAVKIIRAIPKYRDASKIEVRVLNKLKERDPLNKHNCIHLLDWFDHRNHICLVSELLGICVYDFLKDNDFQPFSRRHIHAFAKQLLDSVAFLHDLRLVHTDLKPENILLVDSTYTNAPLSPYQKGSRNGPPKTKRILRSTAIRLIDFGSATFEDEYHSTVVSTRHYRAPEIILGLGWSYPCDAFSLGCILVEFFTGVALFQTHDNLEHLAMMENVMGKLPERFARAGAKSKPEFFKEGAKLDWPKAKATRQSKKDVRATKSLAEIIPPIHGDPSSRAFLDLVKQLLTFDPAQRITVRDALSHPYFTLHEPLDP
ncbi:kinase-like protein [Sistotremastrum niveocremeum HHB9708]|uniref:Kinase-like protein n=2 Tax=Sistotremastraceae TaxID=3402574 RepID=A0A164TSE1_9AGAM|nr:kinase-like protein [Sistotremastrum niveocremeum HHB9708]KZT42264.1 kinase-like protein [Sistotremastrum suecicum HHB10207 ss-3]